VRIEYHPAIEQELRAIIAYYNRAADGLGAEFLNEFERQALTIAAMPLQWRIIEGDIRRALMRRFPYLIYFRVIHQEVLRITVIKHQRQHPYYGLNRK
jgi:plasmid stabilization system protein ParE